LEVKLEVLHWLGLGGHRRHRRHHHRHRCCRHRHPGGCVSNQARLEAGFQCFEVNALRWWCDGHWRWSRRCCVGWGWRGVIGVVSVIIVGIGIVIIVVREAMSRIKPARMLAFSASKSMHCGGTVNGGEGGGVVWVGSKGWNCGGRLFGVASQSMMVCLLDAWFVFVFFMFFIVIE